ncbi:MAG: symmetrical bis(5'-nucleosyl)-tetraphosphatase [Pseudohongiellaceae bacterium]
MSIYAIGDIQGCYKQLRKLLKKVKFSPAQDRLWCVGDLINRGPKSLDTLKFLQDIDDATRIVLGNHDLHFIALHEDCAPFRGKDTVGKLLNSQHSSAFSDWLRSKPLAHYESVDTLNGPEHFLMLHAGVAPSWTVQKTLNLSAEVELALQGEDYRGFLSHMYGDVPERWHNGLKGLDRLRAITNYLTRVRFCDPIGTLKLDVKQGLNATPKGFKPWFEYEKITREASIVFGHWASLEGITNRAKVHALDTGCVWGRELTLMRLEDGQRISVT